MIILSEYSHHLPASAGRAYLSKMEEAARLLGIPIIHFNPKEIHSLDNILTRRNQSEKEMVFWLGYVPSLELYQQVHTILKANQLQLIHTPDEFALSEYFDQYYPFINELSIKSGVAENWNEALIIAKEIGYPIFMKGSIQSLKKWGWENCIANNENELKRNFDLIQRNIEFSLGKVILRKFEPLEHQEIGGNGIPKAHEYRYFTLNGNILDYSFYWNGENIFNFNPDIKNIIESLAIQTAQNIKSPFISIDIARTQSGKWKVIEIGDGQFSDIRQIPPIKFWNLIQQHL